MEEKIKDIISVFIKVPAGQIRADTPIGRSALQSSILLHRMYAKLAETGLVVENYAGIKIFSDLLRQNGTNGETVQTAGAVIPASYGSGPADALLPGLGIDIEEINALPRTADFRKEGFYKMNFSASEIAYCILQPDPYSSFAGLFAAKEAIVKAEGSYRERSFNTIEIDHSPDGKPLFTGFGLSISHSGGMAVAVVARSAGSSPVFHAGIPPLPGQAPSSGRNGIAAGWIAWIALFLSLTALLIVLMR